MTWWKFVGLAGFFGTPEGGAAVARPPRARRDYAAVDVTARLHERLEAARARDAHPFRPLAPRATLDTRGVAMNPTDHLPDVHHDTELEMAEESKPAVQAEHGPGLAPMMDVE